jgi:hypothetical protein
MWLEKIYGKEEELTTLPDADDLYCEWCDDRLFILYGENAGDGKFFCTVK